MNYPMITKKKYTQGPPTFEMRDKIHSNLFFCLAHSNPNKPDCSTKPHHSSLTRPVPRTRDSHCARRRLSLSLRPLSPSPLRRQSLSPTPSLPRHHSSRAPRRRGRTPPPGQHAARDRPLSCAITPSGYHAAARAPRSSGPPGRLLGWGRGSPRLLLDWLGGAPPLATGAGRCHHRRRARACGAATGLGETVAGRRCLAAW